MTAEAKSAQTANCWLPAELTEAVHATARVDFIVEHVRSHFLVVALPEDDEELAAGLRVSASPQDDRGPLPGHAPLLDGRGSMTLVGVEEEIPAPDWLTNPSVRCFVLTLPWPRRGTAAHRWKVGRSPHQQIVLQHQSVSRAHACMDIGADGGVWLRDEGSRNRTAVAGEKVAKKPVRIRGNDEVRFGSVRATIIGPDVLWPLVAGET